MSIYSGFATRKQESEYNQYIEKMFELLLESLFKYIRRTSLFISDLF
jgi:hypothetical protein